MGEAAVASGSAHSGAGAGDGRLFATPQVAHERRSDGSMVLRSARGLGAVPRSLGVLLERWAAAAPDRLFLAEREASGGWRHLTYEAAAQAANSIGQSLLDRQLGPDRPLMILAENGIDHALMTFGAMHVGVPVVPVSTAYARLSQDFGKLRYIFDLVAPGLDLCRRGGPLRQGAGQDRRHAPRDRGQPRQPRRRQGHALLHPDGGAGRRLRSMRRLRAWGRTRWPRSSSPRARPASPRA